MANPEHLAKLKEGVAAWNQWRTENPSLTPDLSETNLGRVDLRWANLSQADLRGATVFAGDASDANLSGTDLRRALLSGSFLARADLSGAALANAALDGTNLSETNVCEATFCGTRLHDASFRDATIGWTVFADVDLSETKGLETVTHLGPSTIGIDTLYRSGGKIPEAFLRGAGVPDTLIQYIGSLVGKPFEFYSCFISYSTKDEEFAKRLYADLQANGVRCWFSPEDVQGGKKLHEQIDAAIRLHDRLLLILSESSMGSEWVKTEISKALKREREEKRRMLFPISLVDFKVLRAWEYFDRDVGKDLAREIREYFIPDFSRWKDHDCYKKASDRLLRDLKTSAAAP